MTRDVHWCVAVDYQQIGNDDIANQIHGFKIDYGKFILITFIIWLAPRTGKMNQIARCDWLPERARWSARNYPLYPAWKIPRKPYNKSFFDQVCSVKTAGCWPRSFLASLWTSTSSRSINAQKKNLANIQPSWPHTWSITHTYSKILLCHTVPLWSRYSGSIWSGYLGASMSHF